MEECEENAPPINDGLFNAETGSAVAPFKTPKGIPPDLTEEFYEEFPNWEETAVFYGNDPTGTVEDWPDELEDAQKIDLFWDDYKHACGRTLCSDRTFGYLYLRDQHKTVEVDEVVEEEYETVEELPPPEAKNGGQNNPTQKGTERCSIV